MYYMVTKKGIKKEISFKDLDCIAFERTENAKICDWVLNDSLRFMEVYDKIKEIEDVLIQRIFGNEDLYYETLEVVPEVILDTGLKTDVFGGKKELERIHFALKNSIIAELVNKHLYFSDLRMMLNSIENLLMGLEIDIINYYLILSETQLILNNKANTIWKMQGPEAFSASSILAAYFTKAYSILDLITKLVFEINYLHDDFKSYPKLKSSKILFGERKKLPKFKVNTVFDHDETIRIIESIRHEVVHNGTWEAIPTIFIKVQNNIPVEKFMLFPDFKEGYYEKYINRYHFYSQRRTANNELPIIHVNFVKQIINTLEEVKLNTPSMNDNEKIN